MSSASSRFQINSLTATRAVAAIMVFIHHFGADIFPFNRCPSVFHSGNVAVGYFFVLSGFVLFISYHDKVISYGDFMKRRIGRIVPIYLIALLMAIYVAVAFNKYDLFAMQSIKEIVLSALFLQSFVPSYPLVLNGPGWTISVEMAFYVLFPLLLLFQKKSFRSFIILTAVLYLGAQYFHLKYYPQRHSLDDNIVDTIFFSPEIHISQFLIGMIGAGIFNKIRYTVPKYRFLPLAMFAVIILLIAYRPENLSYQVGLIAPLFMLLILFIAISDPKSLNFRPLVYLGEISYGIYILQQPVHKYLEAMNTQYLHIPIQVFFWFALGVLIAVASATYYLIELPLRKKISAITFKRKTVPAA